MFRLKHVPGHGTFSNRASVTADVTACIVFNNYEPCLIESFAQLIFWLVWTYSIEHRLFRHTCMYLIYGNGCT